MRLPKLLMRLYVGLVTAVTIAGLTWVYAVPPPSLKVTRDGVPHFAPPVVNPATGEPVPLSTLVRHYKGERP